MNKTGSASFSLAKLTEYLKGDKGRTLLLIVGAVAILLIFLSSILPSSMPKEEAKTTQTFSVEAYTKELENRLMGVVCSIQGVGETQIMVTLENGVEYVYESEERKNTDKSQDISGDDTKRITEKDDTQRSVTVVDGSDGKEALVRTQKEPTVKGVIIVCAGGDDAVVQQRVTQAVTTALDISSKRVCVTKLSK